MGDYTNKLIHIAEFFKGRTTFEELAYMQYPMFHCLYHHALTEMMKGNTGDRLMDALESMGKSNKSSKNKGHTNNPNDIRNRKNLSDKERMKDNKNRLEKIYQERSASRYKRR